MRPFLADFKSKFFLRPHIRTHTHPIINVKTFKVSKSKQFTSDFGIATWMLHKKTKNHNLIRGTLADTRRHQRVCMHLELLLHVATEPKMGFRQELLDRLLHVTTEPPDSEKF